MAVIDRPSSLVERVTASNFATRSCEALKRIGECDDEAELIGAIAAAAKVLGADVSCFISLIRDDVTRSSCRLLCACDAAWLTGYAQQHRYADDPWLRYAMSVADPFLASDIKVETTAERAAVDAAAAVGFRSVVVVPAPSTAGESRVGVLYLGTNETGYYESDGYLSIKLLARSFAMELHQWWMRRLSRDFMSWSGLTERELNLLRLGALGHGSKKLAKVLGVEAKTIDCRFQRLNAKLGTPNRRASLRLARLYGLL